LFDISPFYSSASFFFPAMPMPYPPVCPTKVEIFTKSVGHRHCRSTSQKVRRTASNLFYLIKLPTDSVLIMQ
jgi:hypothetical protein